MVTMQQIADACGVSRGTVDRALHGKPGIRPEVAKKIQDKAREMGYLSARVMPTLVKSWKIGVVLHSSDSGHVHDIYRALENLPNRDLYPLQLIIRTMKDADVSHEFALIQELVEIESVDGLIVMPLADPLIRDTLNALANDKSLPIVTINTDLKDLNRLAYVGPDDTSSGRTAAALLAMSMGGKGKVQPVIGLESGHFADAQRLQGFLQELQENYPDIEVLKPECCYMDSALSERLLSRALEINPDITGIYLTSAGKRGAYNAIEHFSKKGQIHLVIHDTTEENLQRIRTGDVDFVIGQDAETQGVRSIQILYEFLQNHTVPDKKEIITEISVKFRCNI
ncbi:MAG: LacI family DNA-binding transcriptional regulator [Lachnospiraceae bacterium]|nr:LacI family DNA-binding transcriptional regulator [Lachnospiraceae bacterium]